MLKMALGAVLILFFFFFTHSFRNCPSDDARHKSRHGDVLGDVALERYGDHGKVDSRESVAAW